MADIWKAIGPHVVVQTLFEQHSVYTVEMGDMSHYYAENLAEHLNETGFHLMCSFGGDTHAVPRDYESQRAAAWGIDKPE